MREQDRIDSLTPRERDVLRLVAKGKTNWQIAEELGMTFASVKWYVSEVISKLGVTSREEAAAVWHAQSGVTRHLRRSMHALAGTLGLKLALGLTGVACAGGLTVAALTIGDSTFADDDVTPTVTPTPTLASLPSVEPNRVYVMLDESGIGPARREFTVSTETLRVQKFNVEHHGAQRFRLDLECDAGSVAALDIPGRVGAENGGSLVIEIPNGSTRCAWVIDADGEWRIRTK